ncbi:ABC transporter ATP-binding protein [Bacillus sp. FJAT-29790]|uniref:ABC transporter ATP-binding protein n=1 Tax=Bacillus sp. FJAT-29790 TaxID=1895002 RepID=UPI001C23A508|nr:ABC transporter ATP-binding protein [Bacillus sp. FJAT-29790]MBU8879718.1 ABC transporter ATP-binding protein [Bacillus sp. FJAT-29790]
MTNPKVEIKNVTKIFSGHKKNAQVLALDTTNLKIMPNEFITILGPSGCGKSTLLRIVAGLEEQTTGHVYLDGHEVSGPSSNRGMVFQAYSLFPWLTVEENILFGLKNNEMTSVQRKEIVKNYIELVRLNGFEKHYPRQLSGGMQQRVAIARALANDPEILLLDEPFGALDNQTRTLMQELLLEIWEKSHKTILFITHDVEESIFLANRVIVMTSRPGRIKADIPIELEHPRAYNIKVEPRFLAYKEQLTELIREESLKAMMEVK